MASPRELDRAAVKKNLSTVLMRSVSASPSDEGPETATDIGFGKRIGDGTTEAISRFTEVGVANDLHSIEERIERALAKLDDGSYGVCDECGGEIVAGRLEAAPESALCIECARAAGT